MLLPSICLIIIKPFTLSTSPEPLGQFQSNTKHYWVEVIQACCINGHTLFQGGIKK